MSHDTVRLRTKARYAELEFDVWPRRLTEAGLARVGELLPTGTAYGASGCYCGRLDPSRALALADELRGIAAEHTEAVGS